MEGIREGDIVQVHYVGRLQTGEVFDSSEGQDPLIVKIGDGKIISGFEQALIGMRQGEKKTFDLTPEQAFGHHREELVHEIDRKQVPPHLKLEVGMQIALETQGQEPIPAQVVELNESTVTLDTNHPLAGKSVTFEVDIVDIQR